MRGVTQLSFVFCRHYTRFCQLEIKHYVLPQIMIVQCQIQKR